MPLLLTQNAIYPVQIIITRDCGIWVLFYGATKHHNKIHIHGQASVVAVFPGDSQHPSPTDRHPLVAARWGDDSTADKAGFIAA